MRRSRTMRRTRGRTRGRTRTMRGRTRSMRGGIRQGITSNPNNASAESRSMNYRPLRL